MIQQTVAESSYYSKQLLPADWQTQVAEAVTDGWILMNNNNVDAVQEIIQPEITPTELITEETSMEKYIRFML